jgi:L-methionine (R)-S-oxide reductase
MASFEFFLIRLPSLLHHDFQSYFTILYFLQLFLYLILDKVSFFSIVFDRMNNKLPERRVKTLFQVEKYRGSREENYELVIKQLKSLLEGETNRIANLSNASALLNQFLDRINWVGFYLFDGEELVLGPFQGLPACVRIPLGKGVCGTSAESRKTIRVEDVHQFPGHIACDAASQSEIVVPMMKNGELLGVLDIDSPEKNRFDELDQKMLEKFTEVLVQYL